MVHVVGAAIIRRGMCLVARRKPGGSAGGKWEFPGGKVEPGETPEAALEREIQEELGETIVVEQWLGRGIVRPDSRLIVLDVYWASPPDAWLGSAPRAHDEICWAAPAALLRFDWADADIPIVPRVAALLERLQNPSFDDD